MWGNKKKKKGVKEIFRHVQECQRKRLEDDLELEKPSLVINFSHFLDLPDIKVLAGNPKVVKN